MSRRTTKQRRADRRRRFAYHLANCRRLMAEVGTVRILAAIYSTWYRRAKP